MGPSAPIVLAQDLPLGSNKVCHVWTDGVDDQNRTFQGTGTTIGTVAQTGMLDLHDGWITSDGLTTPGLNIFLEVAGGINTLPTAAMNAEWEVYFTDVTTGFPYFVKGVKPATPVAFQAGSAPAGPGTPGGNTNPEAPIAIWDGLIASDASTAPSAFGAATTMRIHLDANLLQTMAISNGDVLGSIKGMTSAGQLPTQAVVANTVTDVGSTTPAGTDASAQYKVGTGCFTPTTTSPSASPTTTTTTNDDTTTTTTPLVTTTSTTPIAAAAGNNLPNTGTGGDPAIALARMAAVIVLGTIGFVSLMAEAGRLRRRVLAS